MINEAWRHVIELAARKASSPVLIESINYGSIALTVVGFLAGAVLSLVVNNWLFGRDIAAMKATLGLVVEIVKKTDDRVDRHDSRITHIEGRFDGFPRKRGDV